jgi:hypothetical protein
MYTVAQMRTWSVLHLKASCWYIDCGLGGGHWALVLEIYVSPKIGIFKKNGAKNLNFFTFTIGYEQ